MIFNLSPLSLGLEKENQGACHTPFLNYRSHYCHRRSLQLLSSSLFCCTPPTLGELRPLWLSRWMKRGRRAAESRAFFEAEALQVINIARGGRWEETENMWVYVRLCVFLLKCLIGELTCRYPLKGISLASLLPYKQRNKASATPVSTPTQRGPPGRL